MIRLFRVFIPVSKFTLVITDILLISLAFLATSYALTDVDPTDYLFYDGGILSIVVVVAMFLLGIYFNGLYSDIYVKSRVILLYQIIMVSGLTFLFEGLVSSASSQLRVPIQVMIGGAALSVALFFVWRLLFSRYALEIFGNARVLLVGTDPAVEAVRDFIEEHPESGFRVYGFVREEGIPGEELRGVKSLGHTGSLVEIIDATQPSRVVVGLRGGATPDFAHVLEDLRYAGQSIEEAAETYETVCGRVWVSGIQPAELIYTSHFGAPSRQQLIQRLSHPLIALLAIIVFSPVMALVWLTLRLRFGGPTLESHICIGINREPFRQHRFYLPRVAKASGGRALRAIRRYHLDGLPQLFNVLKGEMAFVGPRAEGPEFVERLSEIIPYYPQRFCVRPGMTGWARIKQGPFAMDTLAMLEYDLYYIKYMAMSLDTVIVFQALREMFKDFPEE